MASAVNSGSWTPIWTTGSRSAPARGGTFLSTRNGQLGPERGGPATWPISSPLPPPTGLRIIGSLASTGTGCSLTTTGIPTSSPWASDSDGTSDYRDGLQTPRKQLAFSG